jgi:polyisoprenoid-binding protein YceI
MMREIFLSVLFIFLGLATPFAQQKVISYSITFEIKNAGIIVEGKFGGLKANIDFDAKNVESAKIYATVESTTIDTDLDMRDNHLRKSDYFDVQNFPIIAMESLSFKKTSDSTLISSFILKIKGIEKKIEIPVLSHEKDKSIVLKAIFRVNRRDFKVGGKSLILDDDVKVKVEIEFTKKYN